MTFGKLTNERVCLIESADYSNGFCLKILDKQMFEGTHFAQSDLATNKMGYFDRNVKTTQIAQNEIVRNSLQTEERKMKKTFKHFRRGKSASFLMIRQKANYAIF